MRNSEKMRALMHMLMEIHVVFMFAILQFAVHVLLFSGEYIVIPWENAVSRLFVAMVMFIVSYVEYRIVHLVVRAQLRASRTRAFLASHPAHLN